MKIYGKRYMDLLKEKSIEEKILKKKYKRT
jgi:hypothetical protein